MNRRLTVAILALALPVIMDAQDMKWNLIVVQGTRTGVKASTPEDIDKTMGHMDGKAYVAPNGNVFKKGATPAVAKLMLDKQPEMADVKTVIAHSAKEMSKRPPESELSNWFVDALMEIAEEKSGKHVDVGIANFGGIRADLPGGPILMDDIMSMFPFKNNLCYVEIKGSDLRAVFEKMAERSFQVIGGARVVVQNRKLVSCTIGGQPLDDDKYYGLATISFLLNGGDGLHLGDNARAVESYEYILDCIVPYVKRLEAEGLLIDGHIDGRVTMLDENGKPMDPSRMMPPKPAK